MASIPLVSLVRTLAHQLYAGSSRLPVVFSVTDTIGAFPNSTLIDAAKLKFADADVNLVDGVYARIDELVGAGPASGSWSRVKAAGLTPATGTLALSPDLSAAIQAGTDYSLHLLRPDILLEAVKWAIGQIPHKAYGPVSLVADADMEASGVTEWPLGGAGVRTKVTVTPNVWAGKQSLFMDNAGVLDYVHLLTAVPVNPGEQMFLSAIARASVGTAKLIPRNATVPADILPTPSSTSGMFVELLSEFTVPSTCRTVDIQLQGLEAAAETYWDDVILLSKDRRHHPLPSWVDRPGDVFSVGYWDRGSGGSSDNTYRVNEGLWREWPWWAIVPDPAALVPYKLELNPPPYQRIYVRAWKKYAKPTLDLDTTEADETAVLAGARVYMRKLIFEGSILDDVPEVLAALKTVEKEDDAVWSAAIDRTEGITVTRMRGLRKYLAG